LVASISIISAISIPQGFPWTSLVWVTLAFSAALWVGRRSTRSVGQVIADIEAEPVQAAPARVATPGPKAVL